MLEWYERGLTSHPYDLLLKNLAHTYAEQGQLTKSAQMHKLNMRVNNPWDLYTIEALAITYFQLGMREKGEAMMKRRDESQWRYVNFM